MMQDQLSQMAGLVVPVVIGKDSLVKGAMFSEHSALLF
jgi:hypothetical protein